MSPGSESSPALNSDDEGDGEERGSDLKRKSSGHGSESKGRKTRRRGKERRWERKIVRKSEE